MELNWDWFGYPKRMEKLSLVTLRYWNHPLVTWLALLRYCASWQMVCEAVGGVDVVGLEGLEGGARSYIARQPLRDCH